MEIKTPLLPFVDAQEMSRLHPETFAIPSNEELDALKINDFVKVFVGYAEKFWVKIIEVNPIIANSKIFIARIDNDLTATEIHGLKCDDIISFGYHNICSIDNDTN